ncbi:MAG TPA: ABC transporter permease [Candidatus Angelobacter sp.]|nr:ABC transporter permease [Candidatus Angelobacter sp.]
MRWLSQLFSRRRRYDDLSISMREHLEETIEELMEHGASREEAEMAARREFGNLALIEERSREAWQWPTVESVWADAKYALRQLIKSPVFAVTVILTMALGIGANVAIFTLMHAVLMKSLPVVDPQSLYRIGDKSEAALTNGLQNDDGDFDVFSYNLFQYLRETTPEFERLAAIEAGAENISVRRGDKAAQIESSEFVSGNYFSTLGIGAFSGRPLGDEDDRLGAAPVAVMSYQAWQSDYGADPSVVGATFYLQSQPVTVVGIAPAGFFGDRISSNPPAFWLPLAVEPLLRQANSALHQADECWLYAFGRIKPVTALGPLQEKISANLRQWVRNEDAYTKYGIAEKIPRLHVVLTPGGAGIQEMQQRTGKNLYLLAGISAFVLLVACANVSNLLLARSTRRKAEISMRMALGAARWRLVRQMFTESVLLGCIGGLAGLAVAYGGARVILALAFPASPNVAIQATPSPVVLGFAFVLSLATGMVFGIAPAWITSHGDPAEALHGTSRAGGDRTTLPQKLMVVFQAALSLVLLAGAGLFTRSLENLERQDFGLQTANRYVVHLNPQDAGYKAEQLEALERALEQQIGAIPGMRSAGLALFSPLDSNPWGFTVFFPDKPVSGYKHAPTALMDRVTPNYLAAVGQQVLRGRGFTESDTATSPQVAIVNQAFAKKFFPGKDPLGLHFGSWGQEDSGSYEIVGVAANAKYNRPREDARPMFFRPLAQWQNVKGDTEVNIEAQSHYFSAIVMNFAGTQQSLESSLRRTLAQINPNLAMISLQTLQYQLAGNFNQERLVARLTALFGLLTLVLAAVGLYGTTSYQVTQKTRDIGLRMAFGANRHRVLALVMGGAFMQVAAGLALGLPVVLIGARYLANQLYLVKPYDPVSLLVAIAVLSAAAIVAGFIPALRAASIDPMRALRSE